MFSGQFLYISRCKRRERKNGGRLFGDGSFGNEASFEINGERSSGPLFDISVMHVVTGCVIRDRVWIIRRQRATSGIRNGSRVPRDLQGHPVRLKPPPASISIAGNTWRLNRGAKRRFRRARTNKADSRNWYALPDDMSRVNLRAWWFRAAK